MNIHFRSISKSILWRLTGVVILAAVTYAFTRNWITTSLVTFIHHGAFLFIFYFHELAWAKWGQKITGLKKKLLKMFTYETILGNVVLGTITYCVTGDWKTMTAVTLTYIGIKHIIYILNEFVWKEK